MAEKSKAVMKKAEPSAIPTAAAPSATKPQPAPAVRTAPMPAKPVSPGERSRMIAEAAYFIAQRRGFAAGQDVNDWLAAEKAIDAHLGRR
jgi:hypothetical protein